MGDRERLLVADDHQWVREGIKGIIGRDGKHEVVAEAKNLKEVEAALNNFDENPFTIASLDVNMPKLEDGKRTFDMIQKQRPGVKVLVFSTDEQRWGDAFLRKGSPAAEYIKTIDEL